MGEQFLLLSFGNLSMNYDIAWNWPQPMWWNQLISSRHVATLKMEPFKLSSHPRCEYILSSRDRPLGMHIWAIRAMSWAPKIKLSGHASKVSELWILAELSRLRSRDDHPKHLSYESLPSSQDRAPRMRIWSIQAISPCQAPRSSSRDVHPQQLRCESWVEHSHQVFRLLDSV